MEWLIIPTVIAAAVLFFVALIFTAMSWRVVVSTNNVHIVQSRRKTVSYGKDQQAGNCYYAWPSWIPVIGIQVIDLPVSVFSIQLNEYAAYDKGRVPFVIDILAFFRIEDSNVAAQRVSSFKELQEQLKGILQGASRSILAQSPIEEILEERAKYGKMFTEATNNQLVEWGVSNVKNVELMDIRDQKDSRTILNIMAVKQSTVDRDSRIAVADNKRAAQTAEIEASQQVSIRQQEAEELVGVRTAEKNQQIGIADQKSKQQIREQEKITADKEMSVYQVQRVREAEITSQATVVKADQDKQVAVIAAEAEKKKMVTTAEGALEQAKLNAQGIEAVGRAKGAADQAVQIVPVNVQITLAKEIGENQGYQKYLTTIRDIEARQTVGVEQAKALAQADIKVISNVGTPAEGLSNVMDVFSAKGGLQIGAALEAIASTPAGQAISEKLGLSTNGHATK